MQAVALVSSVAVLLVSAAPVWLLAMFACGEPATPVPYCTGRSQIASGWGATGNSPLWTPALLSVAGAQVGAALFLLGRRRGAHRPLGFLAAGVLLAHLAGAVALAGL